MDPMQEQQPAQTETSVAQPQQSRAVMYWWIAAVAALLIVGGLFVSLKITTANADYICTKVVESQSACANGSWGSWETVTQTTDGNVKTLVQKRTYTGTRTVSKTLTYLNLRTSCQAGYTQVSNGGAGGNSGFHGGTVTTSSSACQVVQNQTVTQTSSDGGSKVTWSVQNSQTDTGGITTQTQNVASLNELNAQDDGGNGNGNGGGWGNLGGSGEISVQPSLVRRGDTTTVTWTATGVTQCSIVSTGTDSWQGLAISGSRVSSPINAMTTFTLSCPVADGVNVTAAAKVNVAPTYEEQ